MKKLFIFATLTLLLTSCFGWWKTNTDEVQNTQTNNVQATVEPQKSEDTALEDTNKISEAKAKALANAKAKLEREDSQKQDTEEISTWWNDRFIFSYPYECELFWGTQYYYPEKDMEYSRNEIAGTISHMVRRDGLFYTWMEMNGRVITGSYSKDTWTYTEEEMEENFSDDMNDFVDDVTQLAKETCKKWTLDESIFEIPTNINFIDINAIPDDESYIPSEEEQKMMIEQFKNLQDSSN